MNSGNLTTLRCTLSILYGEFTDVGAYNGGVPYPSKIDSERLGSIALVVVEEKGWEGWSLRDVAARLGVAPNALYRHVDDREDLIVEIGAAAAGELRRVISARSHL